ncbi:hypothetical protein E3N88_10367 [Mikania micrantha]|uniref:Uncharacterized protein n=1 Tax=Mikania micrantha TaxID=192012 RepID=A0A5N6PD97_9ASTR|nr:hypothetical protein E3N88_10367 [Mikania micrantha]
MPKPIKDYIVEVIPKVILDDIPSGSSSSDDDRNPDNHIPVASEGAASRVSSYVCFHSPTRTPPMPDDYGVPNFQPEEFIVSATRLPLSLDLGGDKPFSALESDSVSWTRMLADHMHGSSEHLDAMEVSAAAWRRIFEDRIQVSVIERYHEELLTQQTGLNQLLIGVMLTMPLDADDHFGITPKQKNNNNLPPETLNANTTTGETENNNNLPPETANANTTAGETRIDDRWGIHFYVENQEEDGDIDCIGRPTERRRDGRWITRDGRRRIE